MDKNNMTMADIRGIVISLTYAELDALTAISNSEWNGVYLGSQFYVTDKDWLLQTCRNNECKPLSGVMKFMNGELPPAWLTPEVILIDTGVITTSIVSTPVSITVPTDYYYNGLKQLSITTDDVITAPSLLDNGTAPIVVMDGDYSTGTYLFVNWAAGPLASAISYPLSLTCGTWAGTSPSIQAIIEFKKSYL